MVAGGRYKEVYVWYSVSYHGVWVHRRSFHQLSRWERAMHGIEEASNDGRVRVRIIHGLTLVIKNSCTYCKSFISPRSKVLLRMLLGGRLVGVNHHAPPTSTHKGGNQKSTPCDKFVTQLLPYVHAIGLANFHTSISQFHNYPTSMTLTLPLYISKWLPSIKLIIVFNALYMIVFIIPNLDAHHIRTNFITKANTMLF